MVEETRAAIKAEMIKALESTKLTKQEKIDLFRNIGNTAADLVEHLKGIR